MMFTQKDQRMKERDISIIAIIASLLIHFSVFLLCYLFATETAREREGYPVRGLPIAQTASKTFGKIKEPEPLKTEMEISDRGGQPSPERQQRSFEPSFKEEGVVRGEVDLFEDIYPLPEQRLRPQIRPEPPTTELKMERAPSLKATEAPVEMLELLRIKDLDTGRYKAVIVPDEEDKQNLAGYFNIAPVRFMGQDYYTIALPNLARYINDNTRIQAKITEQIELSSPKLFDFPFILMSGGDGVVSLTPDQISNLGRYLRGGGFLLVDDIGEGITGQPFAVGGGIIGTPFDQQMKMYLRKALGDEARFFRISEDHSLFHSFYDFDDGPPLGGARGGNVDYLEGIELNGRLAVLFSDLNIGWYWGSPQEHGRGRGLQFGVNIITFALTQPGGVARIRARETLAAESMGVRSSKEEPASASRFFPEPETQDHCYLAVIKRPKAEAIEEGKLAILFDGKKIKAVSEEGGYNGFLLQLPGPGEHIVTIESEGKTKKLTVSVKKGKVSTLSFSVNRVFTVVSLSIKVTTEAPLDWEKRFGDLKIKSLALFGIKCSESGNVQAFRE